MKNRHMMDIGKIRETIKESAAALFGRLGYDKTSVDEIARGAHKAKTSVYYHFGGKLEVFGAVLSDEFSALQAELEGVRGKFEETDKARCLGEYLMTRMQAMQKMQVYRTYVRNSMPYLFTGELSGAVAEARQPFDDWERDFFITMGNRGREAGVFPQTVEPPAFAGMLMTLLKGLELHFYIIDDYASMKSTYESMVELLIYRNAVFRDNQNNCIVDKI